jgi:hypothetical protein
MKIINMNAPTPEPEPEPHDGTPVPTATLGVTIQPDAPPLQRIIPRSIEEIVTPFFDLTVNRIVPGMSFADYQAIPAVNASLLRQETPCEMAHYLGAMAELPVEAQWLVESKGADVTLAMGIVQEMKPRTVPTNFVVAGKRPGRSEKITDAQQKVVDALSDEPRPAKDFHPATLNRCLNAGWAEIRVQEVQVVGVSESVKEGRAFALAVGDATHKAILEPHMWDEDTWHQHWQLSPTESLTSKMALEAQLEDPMRRLITPEIVDIARRCRDAVWKHKRAAQLLLMEGDSEVSVEVWDPEMQCRRKIRIDRLPRDKGAPIVDIKTMRGKLTPRNVRKSVYEFGYHVQDAFYTDTLAMLEGAPRPGFEIIAVTKTAPFIARVFDLNTALPDESFYQRGRQSYYEGPTARLPAFVLAYEERKWGAYEDEGAYLLTA